MIRVNTRLNLVISAANPQSVGEYPKAWDSFSLPIERYSDIQFDLAASPSRTSARPDAATPARELIFLLNKSHSETRAIIGIPMLGFKATIANAAPPKTQWLLFQSKITHTMTNSKKPLIWPLRTAMIAGRKIRIETKIGTIKCFFCGLSPKFISDMAEKKIMLSRRKIQTIKA